MRNADARKPMIERVTEIYVAVFPVPINRDRKAEVILAGYQKDPEMPNMSRVRATVETHPEAVLDLVELCDEIVNEQSDIESYRLLKFDKDGIHILSPEDFRTLDPQYAHLQWGCC
jgi:hypothetical protein